MDEETMRANMARMQDFTFTASTGAQVRMDLSLLRSMSEAERSAARSRFDALARELRLKYANT